MFAAIVEESCLNGRTTQKAKLRSFMPYKDPERKCQRERASIASRETQGEECRPRGRDAQVFQKPARDLIPGQQSTTAWKVVQIIGGFALVVGIIVLAAWGEVTVPDNR
jgi:hypothetical protein